MTEGNDHKISTNFDDDCYDYAIVLKPDEEYSKVVKDLDNIFDINEYLDKILKDEDSYDSSNEDDDEAVWNYDDDEANFNDGRHVSKGQYKRRITVLNTQKILAKEERRRSNVDFKTRYNINSIEARKRFGEGLQNGFIVRRHRAYRRAEPIILQSKDGSFETIQWETASSKIISSRSKNGRDSDFSKLGILPEDLDDGDSDIFHSFFKNMGLLNIGHFQYTEIVAVHQAKKLDPTSQSGDEKGTRDLRLSVDDYNEEISFSLILKTPGKNHHDCYTLDIECPSLDSYVILYSGFMDLFEKSRQQRIDEMQGYIESEYDNSYFNWPSLYSLWTNNSVKNNSIMNSRNNTTNTILTSNNHSIVTVSESKKTNNTDIGDQDGEVIDTSRSLPTSSLPTSRTNNDSISTPRNNTKKRDPIEILFSPLAYASNTLFHNATLYNLSGSPYVKVKTSENDNNDNDDNHILLNNDNNTTNNNINSNLPPVQFLGWKAAGTQIWARLKMACVDVKIEFSWDLSSVLMKIKCPQDRLEIVAEQMGMRMKNRNGSIRKFKCSKRDMFRYNSDGTGPFFKSSEKQQIIEYLLCCKIRDGGAGLDEDTELGKFIQQRFPLHKSNELNNLCRKWVTFWRIDNLYSKYLNKKYDFNICTICCMPITFIIKLIYVYMNHYITHVLHQPLHEVAGYFGENIAFYFAFLEFYTRWLIIPSVAGLIVFYFQVCTLLLLLLLL